MNRMPTTSFQQRKAVGYVGCSLYLNVELTDKHVLKMNGHFYWHDTKTTMGSFEGETIDSPDFKKWAESNDRIKLFYMLRDKYGKKPITDEFDLKTAETLLYL